MEPSATKHSQAYRNRSNPSVVVYLVGHAQYRLGELKTPVVIYQRGTSIYVRLTTEFHTKFEPVD